MFTLRLGSAYSRTRPLLALVVSCRESIRTEWRTPTTLSPRITGMGTAIHTGMGTATATALLGCPRTERCESVSS